MNNNEKGLNVLVCGSQKFDDRSFVFGMLDQFWEKTNGNIKNIFTSKFSGTCEFAREWLVLHNEDILTIAQENQLKDPPLIRHRDCTFDMHLQEYNHSLYSQLDLSDFILQNDPFYIKGKELLQKNDINLILAFPNSEGILGPSTYNINRFAKLAGIGDYILDCSQVLHNLTEERIEKPTMEEIMHISPQTSGFVNKHPGRKF